MMPLGGSFVKMAGRSRHKHVMLIDLEFHQFSVHQFFTGFSFIINMVQLVCLWTSIVALA